MSILLADIDATCAALGYTDGQRYHAEPDALQGLKHLIWILRRDLDNHEYRRHLGHAKVLQTDLVYMLPDYVNDNDYADVLIRLLVILTNPTLLLYRDGPPKDNHGRKIYLELIDILQGYKSAFTRDHLWSALFGKLKQSLAIDWALRSEEQNLLIERILVLIRNVLQVPANPEAECRADNDASLHDQVIWALHKSGILDLVLFIISSSDEHQFHLHCLEILCLLYREQTAENLADASLQRSVSEKLRDEQELLAARRREKQRLTAKPLAGRHSRFGGTYVIRNLKSVSDRDIICHQPLERVVSIDFDREKQQQKRSYRHISEESQVMRRSAFSVRLCLREYCIEILNSAYNTLVRQVRHLLQRTAHTNNHDDSFLLWIIRFFMEFNRLNTMKLELVSESLSVQCFHWVLTCMQHDMDMIVTDKQHARLWAKRLNVALQTFRELLHSLLALQKLQDDNACALFNMLLNNVCYVLEYRETILHLLMNYNETQSTKAFLRDVVETANIFIKMMEKFCKDEVVVQEKKRTKKRTNKKSTKLNKTRQETEEELSNKWVEMANEMSEILTNGLQMAEGEQPIPFDAASDKSIDDQRDDCLIRIHKLLRNHKLDHAIALLRSAREVWPENDVFGATTAAPEDELLLLREIFMHNITTLADESSQNNDGHENAAADNQAFEGYDDADEEEYGDIEDMGTVEKTFKFEDFLKRLLNAKIVRACVVVLTDWEQISTKSLKAAVTILYRIAYGCSCPAMLYQAKLFRIFQQVFNAGRDAHHEELRRLGVYVVRKFVKTAPNNPKIYAELLFYKSIKEANELENGYCDAYESGTKGSWTEEQEAELRFLFEENQRNPASDKDVIDWLLDNLIDKTRTRRGVLKKLKEMNLMFKAPTKKSTASSQSNKNLWKPEEDEELHNLYSQNRMNNDCLEKILQEFQDRRNKQQILKRLLQLGIIADKSEILPEKPRKPKNKQNKEKANERELMEGGHVERRPKKTKKPQKVRTPLHVGTVKDLLARVDEEQYKEALEWLRECLQEAAEDPEEAIEEDDGVPLVPLQELQKQAMEDENYKKLLVALGIQPPVFGMENYWRIPTYLNKADLKLRASIIAGDEITQNEEESEELDKANNTEDDSDGDEVRDVDNDSESNESEDDYLETLNKPRTSDYLEQKREKMQTLMFSKSDDETEERQPLKKIPSKQKNAEKKTNSESEDDLELINKIKKKLDKKKRNYDLSSEEEEDENIFDKLKNKFHEDLFDQVRDGVISTTTTTNNKKENTNNNADNINNEKDEYSADNLLQFNSEDYRKRLAELGDSSEEENIEKMPELKSNLSNNRQRRANVIDSDSEEEEEDDANMQSTSKTADKTTHQENIVIADDMTHKKRRRPSQGAETADNDQHNVKNSDNNETVDDGDEDYQPIRKVTAATILDKSVENPSKRRRVAVIDDSDEDDN